MGTNLIATEKPPGETGTAIELWTTEELARFMGCSTRHVFNLRKRGLPHFRIGDMVRFVPSRVIAWLEVFDTRVMHDPPDAERANQLADIAASGDEDNAECAAADLAREFFDTVD